LIEQNQYDIVLIDESMPGISGLETLQRIKEKKQWLPVVMVTKNEAEQIMEEAIGSQISDYLIKPVNPHQVLLSLKKILDSKSLISDKTTHSYQIEFRNLFMALNDNPNHQEWSELYKKLVYWELEMSKSESSQMMEVLTSQKKEANTEFSKFITKNYSKWIKGDNPPMLSHQIIKERVLPMMKKDKPLFFVLIDNLRFDQWKSIEPLIIEYFRVLEEETFYSILPTSTQYARNAIFSGLMPIDIAKKYPNEWLNDDDDGGKNMSEEYFFGEQLKRLNKSYKYSYTKITNHNDGAALINNIQNLLHNDINIIVYNFVDMLSHARTEMEVLKELAPDEQAYRSLTKSWFAHSPLFEALKKIADKDIQIVIATDHGSVRVQHANKVIGDKTTTNNIRYKHGRNLNYDDADVLAFKNPADAGLPSPTINSSYIFARESSYLCYPNNYNHFVNFFRDTFQHGGISLEEMIVPLVFLEPKK
jgi:response regulator of citrate/malate metabolism